MINERPSIDVTMMAIAAIMARRSTCVRRAVGCVLADASGHILATGFNGVPAGWPHCNEVTPGALGRQAYKNACAGAWNASGTNLDGCCAIHAEQNALLQCPDPRVIATCYVTTSPCVTCTRILLNTACRTIVFADPYADSAQSESLWKLARRTWRVFPKTTEVDEP